LLFSFAFNCAMLGFKLPEVRELAKMGARRMKAVATLNKDAKEAGELKATREERRRSSAASMALTATKGPPGVEEGISVSVLNSSEAALREKLDRELADTRAALEHRDAQLNEAKAEIAELKLKVA
jgi:hypothetical protein